MSKRQVGGSLAKTLSASFDPFVHCNQCVLGVGSLWHWWLVVIIHTGHRPIIWSTQTNQRSRHCPVKDLQDASFEPCVHCNQWALGVGSVKVTTRVANIHGLSVLAIHYWASKVMCHHNVLRYIRNIYIPGCIDQGFTDSTLVGKYTTYVNYMVPCVDDYQ